MSDPSSALNSNPSLSRNRVAGLLLLCLFAGWQLAQLWPYSLDDAYISMTYAQNLAAGNGLVFNLGERVEGFSNPLWVLLLALGGVVGVSLETWAKLLGAAAMLGTLWLLWSLTSQWIQALPEEKPLQLPPEKTRRKGKHSKAAVADAVIQAPSKERGFLLVSLPLLVAGWCLVQPGVTYYAVAGLETQLTAFLLLLSLALHLRDSGAGPFSLSALPLGLLALTRPEAVLFVGALCGWRMMQSLSTLEGESLLAQCKQLPRRAWLSLLLSFAPFFAWVLFRVVYFGDLFPNTYYAKPSMFWDKPTLGFQYLAGFFGSFASSVLPSSKNAGGLAGVASLFGVVTGLLLGFFLLRSLFQRAHWPVVLPTAFLCLLGGMFALYTGGDWMTQHRFLQPFLPLLCLLVGVGVLSLPTKHQRRWILVLAFLLLCQTPRASSFARSLRENRTLDHAHRSDQNVKLALWLKKHIPAGKSVLTDEIGAIGYLSKLRVLDFWGLVDRRVARILHHKRFNPYSTPAMASKRVVTQRLIAKELLRRKPDYILLDYRGPVPASEASFKKRWVNTVTMTQLLEEMGSGYRFVRGFSLMGGPHYKTFVLLKRGS